jgi:hypothetical protein
MLLENRRSINLQLAFSQHHYHSHKMNPAQRYRAITLLFLISTVTAASAQTPAGTLPAGTPLPVQTIGHLPMRADEPFRAELLYPAYANNQLVLPAKTVFIGTVTALRSDHSRRVQARINGDFTPFHTPVVRFSQVVLPDGTSLPINADEATDGAPILRLTAPPPSKGGFIHKQWDAGMEILHGQIAVFTAPEKGDRLLQLFYHQLPYHPERIEKGTAWTIETTAPLTIPPQSAPSTADAEPAEASQSDDHGRPTWIIEAYLKDRLTSATAKTGQPVQAVVAEPIYNRDHTIAVPQGALVVGAITQAKPARSFARAGTLHFDFKQVILPDGQTRNVQASLTGADAASAAKLAMDSEGRVKPAPQDKIVVPLLLAFLATRPLDDDRGVSEGGKNFVGANGFGLIGNIIGWAGGSPNIATGIGAYGTAVSVYRRWIARGKNVIFARDTRIVVEATPRNAAVLTPSNH